ncbi:MAG TPA: MurR/RpiR family transcriptional regulator [Arenicellales bacterium]|jgi:DNA-binding MurR/RpiR family transcriptional regulator|nr:MurR/RpiR family transcriptional regulator [Arenicellales bacterium]|tara:strand:- start:1445 stop:2413 length:969 start_codon:yes stop_codon:yes gene_type:complete
MLFALQLSTHYYDPMMTKGEYRPPDNLDELRELVGELNRGTAGVRLGPKAIKVLAGLVEAPRETAISSITQLASIYKVNASTLTRLSKSLDYRGFSQLQELFRSHLMADNNFYSGETARLLTDPNDASEAITQLARVTADKASNISSMAENLDPTTLEEVAALLAGAPKIRVQGLRMSYSAACFFSYALGMMRDSVAVLGASGHGIAHGIAQMEPGDLLVAFGSDPYTRSTVDSCRIASERSIRVIALTDSQASPLARYADIVFLTPSGGAFVANSVASAIVLSETLLALVARRLGRRAVTALKERERCIDALGSALPNSLR